MPTFELNCFELCVIGNFNPFNGLIPRLELPLLAYIPWWGFSSLVQGSLGSGIRCFPTYVVTSSFETLMVSGICKMARPNRQSLWLLKCSKLRPVPKSNLMLFLGPYKMCVGLEVAGYEKTNQLASWLYYSRTCIDFCDLYLASKPQGWTQVGGVDLASTSEKKGPWANRHLRFAWNVC